MARPDAFGRLDVRLTDGSSPLDLTPREDAPMRMLVMADFGGRTRPAGWGPVRVDRDGFDTLPARLGVTVRLPGLGPGGDLTLPVAELDDFRPERLWQRVEAFDRLRGLRTRLADPATFAAAAAEILAWTAGPTGKPVPHPPPPTSGAELLERMIGGSPEPAPPVPPDVADWQAFLRRAVAPHLAPATDPRLAELTGAVDDAAAGLLRAVLHHPRFRAVEAAWRGLGLLVRRLDTDSAVHLYVLDVGKEELAADLTAGDDLTATETYGLLVRRAADGGKPWAVVVGDYVFEPTAADAGLLGRVARVAGQAGSAFVAAASPRHVGCASLARTPDPEDWTDPPDAEGADAWAELRRLPEAAHVGLALPRVLLRPPYGRDGVAVEGLNFEELADGDGGETLLWGNPAFAWAVLLGEAYERAGWRLGSTLGGDVSDLPVAVVERGGEREAVSAEALLSDRAAGRIAAAGLAPVRAVRGGDRVRFGSLVSVAEPARALAGRWE